MTVIGRCRALGAASLGFCPAQAHSQRYVTTDRGGDELMPVTNLLQLYHYAIDGATSRPDEPRVAVVQVRSQLPSAVSSVAWPVKLGASNDWQAVNKKGRQPASEPTGASDSLVQRHSAHGEGGDVADEPACRRRSRHPKRKVSPKAIWQPH